MRANPEHNDVLNALAFRTKKKSEAERSNEASAKRKRTTERAPNTYISNSNALNMKTNNATETQRETTRTTAQGPRPQT
eukprot:1855052-Pyramimonas_sp.AAC.1